MMPGRFLVVADDATKLLNLVVTFGATALKGFASLRILAKAAVNPEKTKVDCDRCEASVKQQS